MFLVNENVQTNFSWNERDKVCEDYINWASSRRYKKWKYELPQYYDSCPTPEAAWADFPKEFLERVHEWHWVSTHFESAKFQVIFFLFIRFI